VRETELCYFLLPQAWGQGYASEAAARIEHLTQVLRAVRGVNQLIVREKEIDTLLRSACDLLVANRGYFNAWAILMRPSGEIEQWAVAGDCEQSFSAVTDRVSADQTVQCIQDALGCEDVVVTDPSTECIDCPLSELYEGRAGLCRRLVVSDSLRGVLTVSLAQAFAAEAEETSLFNEVADDLQFALRSSLQERELARSQERYEHLFERSLDAILMGNSEGVIVEANAAAGSLLGYTRKQLLGMRASKLYANPERRAEFTQTIGEKGAVANWEVVLTRQDGSEVVCQESATLVLNESGKVAGVQAILRDITEQKHAEERLRRRLEATVATVAHVTETRDPYTAGHQARVVEVSTAIAEELGWAEEQVAVLRVAAQLHDIGKISVPAEILSKPSTLTESELSLIRRHPTVGAKLLEAVDFGAPVREIILQHHERLDGSGYPHGLCGDDILAEAKILTIADVVEAMSSHRPYRAALGIEAALDEIESHRGTHYDPQAVDACLRLFREKDFRFSEDAGEP